MQAKPLIAIGGENLIDSVHSVAPSGESLCTDNLGGSPYNVSIALARQGGRPHYLTPISKDAFGERLAQNLIDEGVIAAGPRSDAPTTQAVITLQDGVPDYVFLREKTAERAVTAAIIDAAMPDGATHFHAGSLAFAGGADGAAWEAEFHEAARRDLSTSLDPNVRAGLIEDPTAYRARIQRLLSSATIVKLSDEDLDWIYPNLSDEDAIARLLKDTSAAFVALTKGPMGAECWTKSHHCVVTNPPIATLVDTIGAGDTFMATILAQLVRADGKAQSAIGALSKAEVFALLERCVFAACLNCTKHGCNPPTTAAIDAAIVRGTI